MPLAQAGLHNEIRALPFQTIGHLLAQDARQPVGRHVRPAQHPCGLYEAWCADRDGGVGATLAVGFEQ